MSTSVRPRAGWISCRASAGRRCATGTLWAVAAGVDLQLSGHTHGGQIWPFNFLVRLDQPVVHGLSRHSERTLLYTSRGSGFWGPPFRVFAPSELTLLTLRSV